MESMRKDEDATGRQQWRLSVVCKALVFVGIGFHQNLDSFKLAFLNLSDFFLEFRQDGTPVSDFFS